MENTLIFSETGIIIEMCLSNVVKLRELVHKFIEITQMCSYF